MKRKRQHAKQPQRAKPQRGPQRSAQRGQEAGHGRGQKPGKFGNLVQRPRLLPVIRGGLPSRSVPSESELSGSAAPESATPGIATLQPGKSNDVGEPGSATPGSARLQPGKRNDVGERTTDVAGSSARLEPGAPSMPAPSMREALRPRIAAMFGATPRPATAEAAAPQRPAPSTQAARPPAKAPAPGPRPPAAAPRQKPPAERALKASSFNKPLVELTGDAPQNTHATRWVIGCMTGTSLDGLDAAVVAIKGNGLAMRVELVDQVAVPLTAELSRDLRAMAEQVPRTTGDIARTLAAFAQFHLESLLPLAKRRVIDLVAVHGQTVFHAPPLSWQAFAPAPLAHGLGVPVVCDLRAADLADGGQGAPITPLADLILFGHPHERRVVVNLGGFCNITRLPPGREPSAVGGGDVCACNQILDAVARRVLDLPYDRDGRRAWAGATRRAAVDDLVGRLDSQAKLGRSLGTGDELTAWIDAHADEAPDDLARSACAAIAAVIASAAKAGGAPQRLIVAGGGVRNKALLFELTHRAGCPVTLSDDLGTPATLREAMAIAVLGALCQDGVPITLSQITGAERPSRAGLWCLP